MLSWLALLAMVVNAFFVGYALMGFIVKQKWFEKFQVLISSFFALIRVRARLFFLAFLVSPFTFGWMVGFGGMGGDVELVGGEAVLFGNVWEYFGGST